LRRYETTFILDPTLSEEKIEQEITKVEELIEAQQGKIVKTDRWGLRRLTCSIKKKTQGYYVFILYDSEAGLPKEIEKSFRLNESILRYLTIVSLEEVSKEEKEKSGEPTSKVRKA